MTYRKEKFVGIGMLIAMAGIPLVAMAATPQPEPAPTSVVEPAQPEQAEAPVEVVTDIPVPPAQPAQPERAESPVVANPEPQQASPEPEPAPEPNPEPAPEPEHIPLPPSDYPGDSTPDVANPGTDLPDWEALFEADGLIVGDVIVCPPGWEVAVDTYPDGTTWASCQ